MSADSVLFPVGEGKKKEVVKDEANSVWIFGFDVAGVLGISVAGEANLFRHFYMLN